MAEQQELLGAELLREGKDDPKRYLKCAEPFAAKDIATEALKAFMEEVEASREKHLIANVAIIVKDSIDYGDDVGSFLVRGFFGNSLEEEGMIAYALGNAQSERQERIYKMIAGDSIKKLKRSR